MNQSKSNTFKNLHSSTNFFVLGNAWDVPSAKAFELAGFSAIGSSSWALSTMNGVKDGENINFETVLTSAKQIVANTNIPFSVDIEKGYGTTTSEVVANVLKLAEVGCSGINIEDSQRDVSALVNSSVFANKLEAIRQALDAHGYSNFVINARTDTHFLLEESLRISDTIQRSALYCEAGADCLFVPGLTNIEDIKDIKSNIKLPLNILNWPGIANNDQLKDAGVNRFSLGNSVFDHCLSGLESSLEKALNSGEFSFFYEHAPLKTQF